MLKTQRDEQLDNVFTSLDSFGSTVDVCGFSDHDVIHFHMDNNGNLLKHIDVATVRMTTSDD